MKNFEGGFVGLSSPYPGIVSITVTQASKKKDSLLHIPLYLFKISAHVPEMHPHPLLNTLYPVDFLPKYPLPRNPPTKRTEAFL